MLSKVLKNDFIATGRIMGVIYAIVAGVAAVTLISHYSANTDEMTVPEILGMSVLIIIAFSLFILTAVVVLFDFHKSLYAEQGYLTFTLPVKSWKILLSKVIVSTVWFVIALAALFGSFWVMCVVVREELLGDSYDMVMSLLSQVSTFNVTTLIASCAVRIILYFIMFAFFTITVFFTSTLANTRLFQKKNVLWTIVLFIPIAAVALEIADFMNSHIVFSLFIGNDGTFKLITDNIEYNRLVMNGSSPIDIASIFVYLILGAVIFYFTHYIMSKKVNIK